MIERHFVLDPDTVHRDVAISVSVDFELSGAWHTGGTPLVVSSLRRALALLYLVAAPSGARIVGFRFLLRRLRGSLLLHERLEPPLFVHEELVIGRIQGNRLFRQTVRHRAFAVIEPIETHLANIMVRALATPVTEPDEGSRTAPVTSDALVFPEMRRALILFGI
jgi:hypothetical protein